MTKRITIWLAEGDTVASAAIKERYGVASASDAIPLTMRIPAESQRVAMRDGKRMQEQEQQYSGDGT